MFSEIPVYILYPFLFIFGTAIGSFLNVLIERLPNEQSIMGRSHCDHCKRTLQWYELFPLVSYIVLGGRSKCCHKKLSPVMFLVELLTGVIFILSFLHLGSTLLDKVLYLGIVSALIVIFFADAKYQIIPDSIQFALLILSIGLFISHGFSLDTVVNHLISGVTIMTPILLIFLLTKGAGMGFGDVKLAFTIGVLHGLLGGIIVLYIAFITGAIYGVFLLVSKKKKLKSMVAFGPFLVLGMGIQLFFEQQLHTFFSQFFPL